MELSIFSVTMTTFRTLRFPSSMLGHMGREAAKHVLWRIAALPLVACTAIARIERSCQRRLGRATALEAVGPDPEPHAIIQPRDRQPLTPLRNPF
jgi:hypothetical protein